MMRLKKTSGQRFLAADATASAIPKEPNFFRVCVSRFTLLADASGDHGGDRVASILPGSWGGHSIKEEGRTMSGLLKSTVLGAVLLTGMTLAAQSQDVSASPPAGGTPQQWGKPHPFGPKPSGSHSWKQEHYQNPADYATNRAYHPYSTHGVGASMGPYFGAEPKSGAGQINPADYATNRAYHPYSTHGVGASMGPYFGTSPEGGVVQPASTGSTQGQKTN
jgi:hypothetical protein